MFPHLEHDGVVYVLRAHEVWAGARRWDRRSAALPEPVRAWAKAWWVRIKAAPRVSQDEDQWTSRHRSTLDGRVYVWTEDRHEQIDTLDAVIYAPAGNSIR